jgi:hypothetical protein
VVRTSNALRLLAMAGIAVPADEAPSLEAPPLEQPGEPARAGKGLGAG